jgi:transposase
VLNAVRNKIIHRIFAVVKNQTPYQNYLVVS